jgi:cbb3-type cytochrome oxidase maturation protein
MTALVFMIPLSLLFLAGAAAAFFWAVDHEQFEDMDTPGLLPLDDAPDREPERDE